MSLNIYIYLRNIAQDLAVDGASEGEAEGVSTGGHYIAHHELGYGYLNRISQSIELGR